jgi:hypothetical protein
LKTERYFILPDNLTASERTIIQIATTAISRADRTISLDEIVEKYIYQTGRSGPNLRSTINHSMSYAILKLKVAARNDCDWFLVRKPEIGRGAKAEFTWKKLEGK